MTETTTAAMGLLPCPFCGGGELRIDEQRLSPTMKGPGALISVAVRHWCDKRPGVVNVHIEFRGRDLSSAAAQWNNRPAVRRAARDVGG